MISPPVLAAPKRPQGFLHEALLYEGRHEFAAATAAFIRDGLDADEPVLVVVTSSKAELLRAELGAAADSVCFADMAEVGRNPARIIPAWRQFLDEHATNGRPVRGVGEPIWPGRSAPELVECQSHESLLNLAFASSPGWRLLCPYDAEALDGPVLDEARRSHPFVSRGGNRWRSETYRGLAHAGQHLDDPLPEPPGQPAEVFVLPGSLTALRQLVTEAASAAGLGVAQTADLVLAASEVATNSLRYGGGRGVLRLWQEGDRLVVEVRDGGRITEPLVGREAPSLDGLGGRGLWLAHGLCDLVQLRSSSEGTVVRLHMWIGSATAAY